tara:strand:+ start:1153 stop:1434 length:282 start_codon:yes stop_codon:yes gene_type:complete
MEILDYDLEKGELRSLFSTTVEKFDTTKDFQTWKIISNNQNQQVLLEREENGRFHAAEGDLRRKQIHEVREVSYRGPNGEVFVFDEDSGVIKI